MSSLSSLWRIKKGTVRHFMVWFILFGIVFLVSAELFYRHIVPARQSPLPSHDPLFQLRNFNHQATPSGFFSSGRWIQQRSHWTRETVTKQVAVSAF